MYIADLHIHSRYSRATSRDCTPEHLDLWARRKGIGLLGTGDFTHPAWRQELREKLVPAEEGLFTLREELRLEGAGGNPPRFVLSAEISSIYKKNGRVRKVHNVILLPGFEEAETLSRRLEAIGNIHSDGRPILGLDSRDLLEITLEACPEATFIPAHIWTPHFSLFGAFSGFDTIEECFEDLTSHIHALETGLSSDPPMNWRLSALDGYTLVSNSDAHSPQKLGREANLIDAPLSYPGLAQAICGGSDAGFSGTIEFFPEEGKYHFDGHRNCKLCLSPHEAEQYGGKCPVCGKKLTIGVQHRVEQLADRPEGFVLPGAARFESLAPLPEVIGASTGRAPAGVRVARLYEEMLRELGPEFSILRQVPPGEIERVAGPCVAEGIRRLRAGKVERNPGYDGEYGTIRLLEPAEIEAYEGQTCLLGFGGLAKAGKRKAVAQGVIPAVPAPAESDGPPRQPGLLEGLNEQQREAVAAPERAVAVIAGPGTGKTKTLVARIAHLVQERGVKPSEITAVTFTNRAAGELRERLEAQFGGRRAVRSMTIGTFHSICLELLSGREGGVRLLDEYEALDAAADTVQALSHKLSPAKLVREISRRKNGMEAPSLTDEAFDAYCDQVRALGALDFDDLLLEALKLCEGEFDCRRFSHLLVDEFQDSNPIQSRLIRAWGKDGTSLFAIGDPDQAIYGFRGANPRCFEELGAQFPELRRVRLIRNYRSTPEILRCALPVIEAGGGPERALDPQRESGRPVSLVTAQSELSEGIFVAKQINRMVGGIDMLDAQGAASGREGEKTREFSDIALLYRTHRQAAILETCLRKEGIPYIVSGRDDYLQDPKVRGTIGFFRSLLDPSDTPSLLLCARLLWDCPEEASRSLAVRLEQSGGRIAEVIQAAAEEGRFSEWARLAGLFEPRMRRDSPCKLLQQWIDQSGLAGCEPLERLVNMAAFYADLPALLRALLLGEEGDLRRSSARGYASGAVSLMTLHGAKGLEFPVVFLCGVKKGCIPLEAAGRPADLEEERRLLYVGMTRAKEELILLTSPEPSSFLQAIEPGRLRTQDAGGKKEPGAGTQMSLFGLC